MIRGIAHACFYVSNLTHSVAFYREVLGLREVFDYRDPSGRQSGVVLHAGGRTFLELMERPYERNEHKGSFRHICLEIDDLEATATSLRSRGIAVDAMSVGRDRAKKGWIVDPDGNEIELHQYLLDSAQTPWLAAD